MTEPQQPGEHFLVMPFVACSSKGGRYEDHAYAAGYEAGQLDSLLAANRHDVVHVVTLTIHADNRAQADLIAMRHGYTMTAEQPAEPEFHEWLYVAFTKLPGAVSA